MSLVIGKEKLFNGCVQQLHSLSETPRPDLDLNALQQECLAEISFVEFINSTLSDSKRQVLPLINVLDKCMLMLHLFILF